MDGFTLLVVIGGVIAVVIAGIVRIRGDRQERRDLERLRHDPRAAPGTVEASASQPAPPQVVVKNNNGVVIVLLIVLILLVVGGMVACATSEIVITPA